jgi:hypothetical protein
MVHCPNNRTNVRYAIDPAKDCSVCERAPLRWRRRQEQKSQTGQGIKKTVRVPHFSNLYSNYVNVFSHEGVYRFEPKPQVTRLPGVRIAGTFSNTL